MLIKPGSRCYSEDDTIPDGCGVLSALDISAILFGCLCFLVLGYVYYQLTHRDSGQIQTSDLEQIQISETTVPTATQVKEEEAIPDAETV